MKTFGKFISGLILLIVASIVNGFVIMKMWSWFIVTTFHTQSISLVSAMGISMIVGFLVVKPNDGKAQGFFEILIASLLMSISVLGIAYILSLFM